MTMAMALWHGDGGDDYEDDVDCGDDGDDCGDGMMVVACCA